MVKNRATHHMSKIAQRITCLKFRFTHNDKFILLLEILYLKCRKLRCREAHSNIYQTFMKETQLTFPFSNLTIKTLEKGVKYVQI